MTNVTSIPIVFATVASLTVVPISSFNHTNNVLLFGTMAHTKGRSTPMVQSALITHDHQAQAQTAADIVSEQIAGKFWVTEDYLAAIGMVAALFGILAAVFSDSNKGPYLLPVGLALIALAGYLSRDPDHTRG